MEEVSGFLILYAHKNIIASTAIGVSVCAIVPSVTTTCCIVYCVSHVLKKVSGVLIFRGNFPHRVAKTLFPLLCGSRDRYYLLCVSDM